jgi:hypothetical protein
VGLTHESVILGKEDAISPFFNLHGTSARLGLRGRPSSDCLTTLASKVRVREFHRLDAGAIDLSEGLPE